MGRENLSIIFLEEKKKFENRVSFLLIKEYYYSYAGTYVRSKFSFVRTPLRKFPRIQTHLNSNLLFEFGIWSDLYLCQSNFHHFASFTRFLSEILTNIPFFQKKILFLQKKKLASFDDNKRYLITKKKILFHWFSSMVGRNIARSWGEPDGVRLLQILPVSESGWPFTCIAGTWGSYEKSRRWRKATRTCRFLPGGDGVSIREANLPEH